MANKIAEEIEFVEEINTTIYDGAYAFYKVLEQLGETVLLERISYSLFVGEIRMPALKIKINTGVGTSELIPWGEFKVFGISGTVKCAYSTDNEGNYIFSIKATVKKGTESAVTALANKVRAYLKENSLFKGKSITLRTDEKGKILTDLPPEFIDTKQEVTLVYNADTINNINTNIFSVIKNYEKCKQFKIPIKRGILLEGPYGTGKTMTARAAASLCEKHNWTFIMVDKAEGLKSALMFAKNYMPAVVFVEDIDAELSGERDDAMDSLLNTIDGIEFKNTEIMTILTTNHIEEIDKAMLRPGRLDSIISIANPNIESKHKIVKNFLGDLYDENEDYSSVIELFGDITPAIIREVVERSKLMYIDQDLSGKVSSDLLKIAFDSMETHIEFLKKATSVRPKKTNLQEAFQSSVVTGFKAWEKNRSYF